MCESVKQLLRCVPKCEALLVIVFVLFYTSMLIDVDTLSLQRTVVIPNMLQKSVYDMNRSREESMCSSFANKQITDDSLVDFYKTCLNRSQNASPQIGPELFNRIFVTDFFGHVPCEYKNKSFSQGHELVALASIQGSFNTWTRIILEEMTGRLSCNNKSVGTDYFRVSEIVCSGPIASCSGISYFWF